MCYTNLRIISFASVSFSGKIAFTCFFETALYLHNEIYSQQNVCVYTFIDTHTHTHTQNTYTTYCVRRATILLMQDFNVPNLHRMQFLVSLLFNLFHIQVFYLSLCSRANTFNSKKLFLA